MKSYGISIYSNEMSDEVARRAKIDFYRWRTEALTVESWGEISHYKHRIQSHCYETKVMWPETADHILEHQKFRFKYMFRIYFEWTA